MQRSIALLRRRADLAPNEFSAYWSEKHGPFVAASSGYGLLRRRYAQSHVARSFGAFPYDGVADVILPLAVHGATPPVPDDAQRKALAERLVVDEEKFLDRTTSVAAPFVVDEWEGAGAGHKLVLLVTATDSALDATRLFREVDRGAGLRYSRRIGAWRSLKGADVDGEIPDIDVVVECVVAPNQLDDAVEAVLDGLANDAAGSMRSTFLVASEFVFFDELEGDDVFG